jgi:hypothetical protein
MNTSKNHEFSEAVTTKKTPKRHHEYNKTPFEEGSEVLLAITACQAHWSFPSELLPKNPV